MKTTIKINQEEMWAEIKAREVSIVGNHCAAMPSEDV
jgi:hypothetical protein